MIIPVLALYCLVSVIGLVIGLLRRSIAALLTLSLCWWLGACVSAYFAYLAWVDRSYSENWAMLGFIYFTLPYAVLTGGLILVGLYFIRKWKGRRVKPFQSSLLALLTFLALQLIVGFVSAI